MREIKFRALNKDKQWAFWSPPKKEESVGEFDLDTLCEFTGLKDKKGKEIYEWDIVRRNGVKGEAKYRDDGKKKVIKFERRSQYLGWNIASGTYYEVIGNLFHNPELMDSQENKSVKEQAKEIISKFVLDMEIARDYIAREIEWHQKHSEMDSSDFAEGFIKGLQHAEAILNGDYSVRKSNK